MNNNKTSRIVIVTINDMQNYGNRLQNYALAQILQSFGKVDTALWRAYSRTKIKNILFPIKRIYDKLLCYYKWLKYGHFKYKNIRYKKFIRFTKKYVPDNVSYFSNATGFHSKDETPVDAIVFGSDQIWNCEFFPQQDDIKLFLGNFVPPTIRKISYAASFGVACIPKKIRYIYTQFLPTFNKISVREQRGKELVEELSEQNATVVLDPTLMLDTEQWLSITNNFVSDNEKYVITYFLGTPTREQQATIERFATQNGYTIRNLNDITDLATYVAGPEDFVELIAKSQYVFTDSYHACCFSILFHKQFTVFSRKISSNQQNMNSRLDTLFQTFNLSETVRQNDLATQIDYSKVDLVLNKRRIAAKQWLDNALKG